MAELGLVRTGEAELRRNGGFWWAGDRVGVIAVQWFGERRDCPGWLVGRF